MKLIIAEKPELGRAIAEAIPGEKKFGNGKIEVGDYTVTWAVGHILRFKKPGEIDEKYQKWNIDDLPIFFPEWGKTVIEGKESVLRNIEFHLSRADEVIHAGDPDDEGQYLIDEILEYAEYKGAVKRVLINDNNINSIIKAFKRIEDNRKFTALGKAAEARAIADMIVGFNLSRFFTLYNGSKKPLTVGRVQTPILSLVVNRDYEIRNHVKEKFYELFLDTEADNKKIKLKHSIKKGEEENSKSRSYLEDIVSLLKGKKGGLVLTKKELYTATPLPFNLAKLQVDANKKFGYSSQKTQDITQILRDKHKAITYNRSDSEYLSDEHFAEAPKLIPEIMRKLNLQEKEIKVDFSEERKSKCFNNENITAHHGIIPTFSGKISEFTKDELNIYELIAKRYIIQFMDMEKIERTEAVAEIEKIQFKGSSTKVLDPGYKKLYQEEKGESEAETNVLSGIPAGKYSLKMYGYEIQEKETKPKKPYTEATLLLDITGISKYVKDEQIKAILKKKDKDKKGENGSIGTPATRAGIISELFKRGYLENKDKNIVSTELAREYMKILPESLKNPDTTAKWWLIQEKIKEGGATKERLTDLVLKDVKEILEASHEKINQNVVSEVKEIIGKCPGCGASIYESEKSYYCLEYRKGCKFILRKDSKYFDQILKITKEKAKKLLKGEKVKFKIRSQKGSEYENYFTLEMKGEYVNLKKGDFVKKK